MLSLPHPSDPYISNLCLHRDTIMRWGSVFGWSNINVRLYNEKCFVRGDLIVDFLHQLDIKGDFMSYTIPRRLNRSLSKSQLKLISLTNRSQSFSVENTSLIKKAIIRFFDRTPWRNTYLPTQDELDAYENYYSSSDEWVRKRYFQDLDCLW